MNDSLERAATTATSLEAKQDRGIINTGDYYGLHDLRKPLPLIPTSRGRRVIHFNHFINNDLEYLRGGVSSRMYTTSVTKTKAADYRHIKWIEDLVPRTIWSQVPAIGKQLKTRRIMRSLEKFVGINAVGLSLTTAGSRLMLLRVDTAAEETEGITLRHEDGALLEPYRLSNMGSDPECNGPVSVTTDTNGLHKGFDRFQTLLSQLDIHGAGVLHEDANQKFLRSLPSSWSKVTLIMRTKPGLDALSFDDLYNNLRVFERDVKEKEGSASYTDEGIHSFFANQSSAPQLDCDDLEQINDDDLEEMDLKWQVAMISIRIKKFYKRTSRKLQFNTKDPVGFDKTKVEYFICHKIGNFAKDCRARGNQDSKRRMVGTMETKLESGHVEEDTRNYAIMAYSSSNSGFDNKTSSDESDSKPVEYASSESDSSIETITAMTAPVDNAPKIVCEPKRVKSPRENVKDIGIPNPCPKIKKQGKNGHTRKGLGYTRKACFICGSFSHLIRYYDFHEKRMAKQVAFTKSKDKDDPHKALKDKGIVNRKFDGKSESVFLVGYSLNSKAFRVYNIEAKRVEENLHVNFLENKPNVLGKGHAWIFDLDYLTNSMNYEPVLVENQGNKSAGPKEANNSACTEANDDQGANSKEINLHDEHFVLRIWSAYSTTNTNTNSTNLLNAASTPISTTSPSIALNDDEPSYPDDLLMPHLEDNYASLNPLSPVQTRSKVHSNFKAHALNPKRYLKHWKMNVRLMLCKRNCCSSKFKSVKTSSTPIETQKPLVKDEEAADVDVHLYRSMIGSLMYLTAFRSDIMFVVCASFRFQVTPKTSHLQAVKRIFRDAYEKKLIQVLKIHTDDNVADLLTKAFDVSRRMHLNRGKIDAIDVDEDITLVDMEKDEEVVNMDAKPQGRIDQEDVNAAAKGVNVAEPIMAQRLPDEEVEKAAVREKQEKDDLERAQVLQK
nr:hypothetical protein [Tanacetum cinerariifolium]